MSSPAHALTEEEEKLLRAAVAHAKPPADDDLPLKVHRIPYGFETNLPEYGEMIVDATHKAKLEVALKRLLTDGFLQQVEAGHQSWGYTVTDKGFAAIPE